MWWPHLGNNLQNIIPSNGKNGEERHDWGGSPVFAEKQGGSCDLSPVREGGSCRSWGPGENWEPRLSFSLSEWGDCRFRAGQWHRLSGKEPATNGKVKRKLPGSTPGGRRPAAWGDGQEGIAPSGCREVDSENTLKTVNGMCSPVEWS